MKVVVIGSNSFSGSNFINLLLKRGFEVLAISRSNEYHEVFLPYKWNKANQSNITFYKMDVNKDLNDICDECKEKDESVTQILILTGFKICKSCRVSKTIFPI